MIEIILFLFEILVVLTLSCQDKFSFTKDMVQFIIISDENSRAEPLCQVIILPGVESVPVFRIVRGMMDCSFLRGFHRIDKEILKKFVD